VNDAGSPPPVLSICIPTWNRAELLADSLEHLLFVHDLTFPVEIIVSDNHSTDGSMALLESYASRLPLRLMRQRRNLGIVRNTLAAFRAARGAYALYLADDDRLVPEVLVLDDPPTRLFLTDDEAPRDRLLAAGLMPGHVLLLGDLLDQFRVLPRQFVG